MTARDIEKLLRQKHADDIFVAQCKTGPTTTGVQLFDGWAMKPSWVHQLVTGYEIKVSRSDFLRDSKWRGYMPFCNEFYFVAPPGIIDKDEVPEGVGLMVVAGSRLLTKKKAAYHDTVSLELVLKYVLMYHSSLVKDHGHMATREERMEEWKRRIEEKDNLNRFGYYLSKKLQKRIATEIEDVQIENSRLKNEIETYANVKSTLEELGFQLGSFHRWDIKERLSDRLKEINQGVTESARRDLESAKTAIERIQKLISEDHA